MQQAFLTVDLGFGDAGKGSIVDFLTRTYDAHTVVRYNGGAQAGHRVVMSGIPLQEHVFSQFGSGTLAGASTHLSQYMLIDPLAMEAEAEHLQTLGIADPFAHTTIDERALIVTPFQRAANRLQELSRGDQRHGSCGMGIGETMADYLQYGDQVLFARHLRNPATVRMRLEWLRRLNLSKVTALRPSLPQIEQADREWAMLTDPDRLEEFVDVYSNVATRARIVPGNYLSHLLQRAGTVIFEGAQGVLLDEWHGFHPHTTWSTTTLAHANRLLAAADYAGHVVRIGITRAYATRHGAGPFVTEDAALTRALPDACNGTNDWQQGFRVGWLDLVMLRYALEVIGALDYLALTCVDRLSALPTVQICRRYHYDTFIVERLTRASHGQGAAMLAYQEQLTHNLTRCRPCLEPLAHPSDLPGILAADLGLPVGLISTGPTAADKRLVEGDDAVTYRVIFA